MTIAVEAVYEQGILRLLQPIPLAEGTRVEVIVIPNASKPTHKTPAQILAAIAAMPLEGSSEEFSGRDHDGILYSEQNTK